MKNKKSFTIALGIGSLFLGLIFGYSYSDDKVLYQGNFHGMLVNPLDNELVYTKTGKIIVGEKFVSSNHYFTSESGQIHMKHRGYYFQIFDNIEREIRTEGVVPTHHSLDIYNFQFPKDVRQSLIKISKLPQLSSIGSKLYYLERTSGVLTVITLNREPSS